MNLTRIAAISVATLSIASFSNVASADAAAAKAKFADVCAECHEVADYQGEDVAKLTDSIKKIVAGTMKHKKPLKLTDAEAADLAAYMSAGK